MQGALVERGGYFWMNARVASLCFARSTVLLYILRCKLHECLIETLKGVFCLLLIVLLQYFRRSGFRVPALQTHGVTASNIIVSYPRLV